MTTSGPRRKIRFNALRGKLCQVVFDIVCNVQEFLRRPQKNEEQYTHKTHPVRSLSSLSGLQQSASFRVPASSRACLPEGVFQLGRPFHRLPCGFENNLGLKIGCCAAVCVSCESLVPVVMAAGLTRRARESRWLTVAADTSPVIRVRSIEM